MTDTELVNLIANIWVMNRGDTVGFDWLFNRIRATIEKLEVEKHDTTTN